MDRVVPRRSDGSQCRHQPTAVILATLRISFALTLVNALFWSTQWSTQMMSHQDEHFDCHQNVTPLQFHGAGHEPPPVPTYISTANCIHQLLTVVTTISCRLGQSNGSLTCPFAGGVTAGVHNEGGEYIYPPSLNDKDDKNDKESEKSPMRVIGRGL